MPGMTTRNSHGDQEWDAKLRKAVTKLKLGYPVAYSRQVAGVGSPERFENYGEPPGTRTQGPRLKRAMLYRLS